jgi:hypothetical protein
MFLQLLSSSVLLAAGGLVLAAPAHAQARFSIGPRVGLNVSTAPYENKAQNRSYDTAYRTGVEAGVQAAAAFGQWAVQPALVYSQKGFNINDTNTTSSGGQTLTQVDKSTYRLNYLSLPINLVYSLQAGGLGLQVFAGPYASLLLGGEQQYSVSHSYRTGSSAGGGYDSYTTPIKPGDYYNSITLDYTYYSRRLDAGLQAGLGYRLGPAQLQVGYSMGLRNLGASYRFYRGATTQVEPGPTYRNRAFQASLSYLFGIGH